MVLRNQRSTKERRREHKEHRAIDRPWMNHARSEMRGIEIISSWAFIF